MSPIEADGPELLVTAPTEREGLLQDPLCLFSLCALFGPEWYD